MELYIESNLAYNELIQEMQMIDLSIVLKNNNHIEYESHHEFDLVYGIDTALLRWLKINRKLNSSSDWQSTLTEEINKINEMITSDVRIIMWNDISIYFKDIKYKNYYLLSKMFKESKPLKHVAKELLKIEDLSNDSKSRLTATQRIYELVQDAIK